MSIPEESLSERELDVLNFLARGASNREIAEQLVISPNTVKVHVRNIFAKLAVSSRTEATTVALQQGLVTLPGLETPRPDLETTGQMPGLVTDESSEGAGDTAVPAKDPSELFAAPPSLSPAVEPAAEAPTTEAGSASGKGLLPGGSLRLAAAALGLLLLLALASLAGNRWLNTPNEGAGAAQVTAASPEFVEQVLAERWLVSQSMPAAQSHMAVAAVGLHLYQIGGETADGVTDTVHIYDTGTFQWRMGTPKLTAVADVSAAVLFGEIYVAGGRTASGQPTDVVEVYSPANNAWRRVVALPRPIAGALTLSDGSFLYLFGGWDGNQYLADAYVYDPGSDGWRPLPPMSRGRAFAAGGALASRLYVIGGFDGQDEVADCEYYEPLQESWTECPPMLLSRGAAGAAVLFNRLFVLGGGLNGDVASGEWFDAATQTWQVVNMPMMVGEQPLRWTHLGVASVERHIYVVGGQRGAEKVADTFVFVPYPYQSFIPAASGGSSEP
jgi:DNA-binding CsgD family transcriptional regulator/N-acetylneuraminic acid mutarotase